jgi:hypothetical protein
MKPVARDENIYTTFKITLYSSIRNFRHDSPKLSRCAVVAINIKKMKKFNLIFENSDLQKNMSLE